MEPRPAATVVVVREGAAGPQVLVLERSPGSRFAPGFVVFPGGSVDPVDGSLAERWFGSSTESFRACAVRELYEETGILAAVDGLRSEDTNDAIDGIDFVPPPVERMPEMARWVAPVALEVRFDARFFTLAAPAGLTPVPDGVEIARAWWASAGDVLAASGSGGPPLMWPTRKTLEALQPCTSVEEILRLRVPQVEPTVPEARDERVRFGRRSP